MKGNVTTTGGNGGRPVSAPLLSALLVTMIIVFAGSFLTAFMFHFTSISETKMPAFAYAINAIGVGTGGWFAGKKIGFKGWYYGALTGLLFFVIMALVGFLAFDTAIHSRSFLYLLGALLCGSAGGILGVNAHKSS